MADFDIDLLIARTQAVVLGVASMAGFVSFVGFARYAAERFATRQIMRVAASLSYTSLLALVPLAAIGVAVMSAFPVFETAQREIGDLIFTYVAPHAGDQVQQYVDRFVGNTAQLTTVGVIGLAVTTLLLLATIEGAFNVIWGVTEPRSIVTRLIAYWATVTLGPLLLGAGVSFSSYLFASDLRGGPGLGDGWLQGWFFTVLPVLLTAGGLAILYVALPARSVAWRHALAGAVIAAILFEFLKKAFGLYVGAAGSFTSIYGPLAALPLFLVWMYFAWAVVLFGAVIAAAWPEWQALRREREAPATPVRQMMRAIIVLQLLREAGCQGHGLSDEDLLKHTGGSNTALGQVLGRLRAQGYVARTEAGNLVLARDLDGVTLLALRDALGLGLGELDSSDVADTEWQGAFDRIMREWRNADSRVLDVAVKDLVDGRVYPGGAGGDPVVPDVPVIVAGNRPGAG